MLGLYYSKYCQKRALRTIWFVIFVLFSFLHEAALTAYASNPFEIEFQRKLPEMQWAFQRYQQKVKYLDQRHIEIDLLPGQLDFFHIRRFVTSPEDLDLSKRRAAAEYGDSMLLPLVNQFAWAIPNDLAIQTIMKYGRILEVGAGTGYWAHLLWEAGADVVAYDNFSWRKEDQRYARAEPWFEVKEGNEDVILQHPDRNLFLSYPPLTHDYPLASNCLDRFQGEYVIYIGGDRGGPTGDDRFFDLLERDFSLAESVAIPVWPGHDSVKLKVYQRQVHTQSAIQPSLILGHSTKPVLIEYSRNGKQFSMTLDKEGLWYTSIFFPEVGAIQFYVDEAITVVRHLSRQGKILSVSPEYSCGWFDRCTRLQFSQGQAITVYSRDVERLMTVFSNGES